MWTFIIPIRAIRVDLVPKSASEFEITFSTLCSVFSSVEKKISMIDRLLVDRPTAKSSLNCL